MRRFTADEASLVCSVLNTWWPVTAASAAILAVSRSRISPTMMTSGSARTSERSAWANVRPMAGLTSVCTMPVILRSTGSSTV